MKRASKIFIYGAPGSGKTTLSEQLKSGLGYPLVEADYLREAVAQKEKTEAEDPFLYIGTTEAFRKFGEFNQENIIKGLNAVRASMAPYVAKEIEKYPDTLIMEAAFLDPRQVSTHGELVLVVARNEDRHCSQYFTHREKNNQNSETFQAARMLQNYLLEEARNIPVKIIENDTDVKILIEKFTSV